MIDKSRVYSLNGSPVVVMADYGSRGVLVKVFTKCTQRAEDETAELLHVATEELKPYVCPYTNEKRYYRKDGVCNYTAYNEALIPSYSGMCYSCLMKAFEEEIAIACGVPAHVLNQTEELK